jgi:beta-lactamase superfamily II metal-dependent hydrolase
MGKLIDFDVGCANSSIILTNNHAIMIDCFGLEEYKNCLPQNKIIDVLFITHQHHDHFDGISFLLDHNYSVKYLAYSPYQRRYGDSSVELDEWNDFLNLKSRLEKKGTQCGSLYRQSDFSNPLCSYDDVKCFIIGPHKNIADSDTRELHDASLVIYFKLNNRSTVFPGDASDANLNWIANNTDNYCNDILHASHHGSLNGADLDFIKEANANYTVISTKSGVYENVPHPTALQRYRMHTKKTVYRTDTSGPLTWNF